MDPSSSRTIPPNFDTPWALSDVVITTLEADGKKLYANKTILATYSPYFYAYFFCQFAEANSDSANVDVTYEVMQEILRIIYSVDRPFTPVDQKLMKMEKLGDLYVAADKLDIPMVRKLCEDQLDASNPADAIKVATSLNLYDLQAKLLAKMSTTAIRQFFQESEGQFVCTMKDMTAILQKFEEENKREKERHSIFCHHSVLPTSRRSTRIGEASRAWGEANAHVSPAVRMLFPGRRGRDASLPLEDALDAREEE